MGSFALVGAFIGLAARMVGPSLSTTYALERRAYAKKRNDGGGSSGYGKPHQGERERARRRRQIAAGHHQVWRG